jgi:osmotically-inducible protein OsmY
MSTTRNVGPRDHCGRMDLSAVWERQELRAIAETRMQRSGYRELHDVACDFFEGVLTLRGSVPSFYLKQVAQSLVLHLDGVQELNNRLEVDSTSRDP